jgi:5'-methylthioadenosine phosphorylase
MNNEIKLGVIGGSGVYELDGISNVKEIEVNTPYGRPSDSIIYGELGGQKVYFLPRHGRGHFLIPSEVNYRANIYALKSLGVSRIIGVSAVGSLKEELKPKDLVIPAQLFDRTSKRVSTFFEKGMVGHVQFNKPYCPEFSDYIYGEASKSKDVTVHSGGTYVCMEGPQFSTVSESKVYRGFGFDVIGMTNIPETKLAREAEMCYASICMVTDYDVWKEGAEVSVEAVVSTIKYNVENVKNILKSCIENLPKESSCGCQNALNNAIQTSPDAVDGRIIEKLRPIVGKYFDK